MKFKTYLETISGVEVYPLISLAIFFLFFTLLLVYVWKADKIFFKEVKNIPIED